jgi:hypothetical protein
MYKKHKWLSGLRNFGTFNPLRQICDLTGLFNILNYVNSQIWLSAT